MRRHKRELMDALTPIEGEYLTVCRKPAIVPVPPQEGPESPKPTRRTSSGSSSSEKSYNVAESSGLQPLAAQRRPSNASDLRAHLEQSLLGSQSSLASSVSAKDQLEELRAKRKPLKPLAPKKDKTDENRHKRELMKELTPTDYRTVTRTRASIFEKPSIDSIKTMSLAQAMPSIFQTSSNG